LFGPELVPSKHAPPEPNAHQPQVAPSVHVLHDVPTPKHGSLQSDESHAQPPEHEPTHGPVEVPSAQRPLAAHQLAQSPAPAHGSGHAPQSPAQLEGIAPIRRRS